MLERAQKIFLHSLKRRCPLVLLPLLLAGCNPFAPGIDEALTDPNKVLGDRKTVDGLFEWFRNSYQLRDSAMYGQILAPDFIFTYPDRSNNTEITWDRSVEINTTFKMFRAVRSNSLQWNHYISIDTTTSDTLARVERSFNLIINQDDNNIFRGTGSALFILVRNRKGEAWRIKSWYDKSDF